MSSREFEQHMFHPQDPNIGPVPIITTGVLDDWPARQSGAWSDPEYLMSKTIGGRRLVPVETGKNYVDESFGQEIITFKEFMDKYIMNPKDSAGKGYLAQHNLFTQIPSLREDILIPDYCYSVAPGPHKSSPLAAAHAEVPILDDPMLNAWFGPEGTTTPLHTDPYHNILAQVVGKKYIRLYGPGQSQNLYARGMENGIDMSNTSEVDVGVQVGLDGSRTEAEAAKEKFPLFADAQFVDCILNEGDCLYIPIGWWHYVRSLSVSFSVSFWFN
jgi:lysine-specific demethylase 8